MAPVKTVTVPRLELTAATLAVEVDKQIREELDLLINRVIFWTDSAGQKITRLIGRSSV